MELTEIIKEKDQLMKESETVLEADKKRLLGMIEALQKLNNQNDKEIATRDVRIKHLEDALQRATDELQSEKRKDVNHEIFIEKELGAKKNEIARLKEEVQEVKRQMKASDEDNHAKIAELEGLSRDQQSQILNLAEDNLKNNPDANKSVLRTISDLKHFNKDSLEKFKALELENLEIINQNRALQKQVLEGQLEISGLLDKLKELEKVIDGKEAAVKKIERHLELRTKADQGAYAHLVSIKKENELLKSRLEEKERLIMNLQSNLEHKQKRLMENAKLVDRLRYENDRFKTNYKLTNNRLPRQSDDLPPTVGDDYVRPDSYFSVAKPPSGEFGKSRSHSPAVGLAKGNSYGSMDGQGGRRGTPTGSHQGKGANSPFKLATLDGMVSDFGDTRVSELIRKPPEPLKMEFHSFFKASSDGTISNRLKVNKKARSVTFEGLGKFEDGGRDPSFVLDNIFTQAELKPLNNMLADQIDSQFNLTYLFCGSPANIRLFLVHKVVTLFLDRFVGYLSAGIKQTAVAIVSTKAILLDIINCFSSEVGGDPLEAFESISTSDDGISRLVMKSHKIPVIESVKKAFLTFFSQQNAVKLNLIRLTILSDEPTPLQECTIMTCPARRLRDTVYTHFYSLLLALFDSSATSAGSPEMEAVIKCMDFKGMQAHTFLVHEDLNAGLPKDKVDPATEEELLLSLSELQKALAVVRTNEGLYR